MEQKAMKQEIRVELCKMDLARYKGLRPLIEVIWSVVDDEDRKDSMTVVLLEQVAEQFHIRKDAMQRNFRTIVDICWEEDHHGALFALIGRELTKKPTVCQFIVDVANHFMRID